MLDWFRTAFGRHERKVFHVVPYANTAVYTELAQKYGGKYVLRGNGASDEAVILAAINRCTTQGNDKVLLYPGTFVFSASLAVGKAVTIEGVCENPLCTTIDCDTSDVACIASAVAGVVLRNFTIDEAATGTVDTITAAGVGVVIENIVIQGGNIASTTASMNVTGNYAAVRRCKLHLVRKGIVIGGSNAFVEDNWVDGTDGTAGNFGITLTGAAARTVQVARRNTVFMSGAANPKALVVAANADLSVVNENTLYSAGDALEAQADTYGVANLALSVTITGTTGWLAE